MIIAYKNRTKTGFLQELCQTIAPSLSRTIQMKSFMHSSLASVGILFLTLALIQSPKHCSNCYAAFFLTS